MHGAVTVFLPEIFRWTKEILLGGILLYVLVWLGWAFRVHRFSFFERANLLWWLIFFVAGYLFYLFGLVLLDPTMQSLMAARYLALPWLGLLVGLLLAGIPSVLRTSPLDQRGELYFFLVGIIMGCLVSVGFGIWMKFLGGIEVLSNYYSSTISSWVPGQALPLYHAIDGQIRMQGMSSGPVAFGHMMLVGVMGCWYLFRKFSHRTRLRAFLLGLVFLFIFGIWESMSRGALVGLGVLGLGLLWEWYRSSIKAEKAPPLSLRGGWGMMVIKKYFFNSSLSKGLGGICMLGITLFFLISTVDRPGTIDHLTRPIEAVEMGLESRWIGDLGSVGPAARWANLRNNNDDSAFIAENVWLDIWLQTGLIGLIFIGLILWQLWSLLPGVGRVWLLTVLVVTQFATLWDMVPVGLGMMVVFICFLSENVSLG